MSRLAVAVVLALLATTFGASAVSAAAPPNDTYKTATVIPALPYSTAIDLTQATDDAGTPACEAASHRRVWYKFTAAVAATVRLSVGGDQTAELAAWTQSSPSLKGLHLTACAVDGRDLATKLTQGTTYLFSVGQWVTAPPLVATLTVTVIPPPANDAFANAQALHDGDSVSIDGPAFAAATRQASEPVGSCAGSTSPTLWYSVTSAKDGVLVVSVGRGTLVAYSGSTLAGLTELACGMNSGFNIALAAGVPVYLQLTDGLPDADFSVALQTPPANDDFADAVSMGTLPADVGGDETFATLEAGEPVGSCAPGYPASLWYTVTAPAAGRIDVSTQSNPVAVYRGTTLGGLTEVGCTGYGGVSVPVDAGDVLHIQALAGPWSPSASVHADFLQAVSNDDVANAIAFGAAPADQTVELAGASMEVGEPTPSCFGQPLRTAWYTATGTGGSLSFRIADGFGSIVAYQGASLGSLVEMGCASSWSSSAFTIKPPAGAPFLLQVGIPDQSPQGTSLHVQSFLPGPPSVDFYVPGDFSIYNDAYFPPSVVDQGGASYTSSWSFGDGATSSDIEGVHRYTADGDYTVTLTVTTSDGRTGTGSHVVHIRTHDIGIAKMSVPSTARAGQTKSITVSISNHRYPETVTVNLYVNRAGGSSDFVGQVVVQVPATSGGSTTDVAFKYTFTGADATAGKVNFHADAIVDLDSFPADNSMTSTPTKVTR
jgi:hypothetical protein